jgi:hypothetical protein
VAARFQIYFEILFLVKIPKIAKNATTSEAGEKTSTDLESFEF